MSQIPGGPIEPGTDGGSGPGFGGLPVGPIPTPDQSRCIDADGDRIIDSTGRHIINDPSRDPCECEEAPIACVWGEPLNWSYGRLTEQFNTCGTVSRSRAALGMLGNPQSEGGHGIDICTTGFPAFPKLVQTENARLFRNQTVCPDGATIIPGFHWTLTSSNRLVQGCILGSYLGQACTEVRDCAPENCLDPFTQVRVAVDETIYGSLWYQDNCDPAIPPFQCFPVFIGEVSASVELIGFDPVSDLLPHSSGASQIRQSVLGPARYECRFTIGNPWQRQTVCYSWRSDDNGCRQEDRFSGADIITAPSSDWNHDAATSDIRLIVQDYEFNQVTGPACGPVVNSCDCANAVDVAFDRLVAWLRVASFA